MKTVGKSQYLTKKQVDKIFGKDKVSAKNSQTGNGSFTGFAGDNVNTKEETPVATTTSTTTSTVKKPVKKTVKKKGK